MCLYRATRVHKKPIKATRRAFKIVKFVDGHWRACFQHTILTNKWMKSNHSTYGLPTEDGDKTYPTGFHTYTSKKDALAALKIFQDGTWDRRRNGWVVVPCWIRDIVATGTDGSAGIESAGLRNYVSLRIKLCLSKVRVPQD
jgi:hypothetical protein